MLYERVVEVDARVGAGGELIEPLDAARAEAELRAAFADGIRSVAIVLMHGYRHPEHELALGHLAREIGFTQVSTSYETSPLMKLVGRGDTTVVDAYLSPLLRRYIDQVAGELGEGVRLMFMQSNGGLTDARRFQGKDAILSGPAGGIVGAVETAARAGRERIISFDMGGTSTDVAHYDGAYERAFETLVAGVRMRAPMMMIHTVAAGGGSILSFDGARYRVGPESAGADPGPACLPAGRAALGHRLQRPPRQAPARVLSAGVRPRPGRAPRPRCRWWPGSRRSRRRSRRARRGRAGPRRPRSRSPRGSFASRSTTWRTRSSPSRVRRGYDVTGYTLNCFGGAGGQHACLVADALGMTRVMIHPFAGVLSALRDGAPPTYGRSGTGRWRPPSTTRGRKCLPGPGRPRGRDPAELAAQGIGEERIRVLRRAHVRYDGTDTADLVTRAARTR